MIKAPSRRIRTKVLICRTLRMKTLLNLALSVVYAFMALILASCANAPKGMKTKTELPASPKEPKVFHNGTWPANIDGPFYVTTIPALYAEPKDIRDARHQHLKSSARTMLEEKGYTTAPFAGAKYEVKYWYMTGPAFFGSGFHHTLQLDFSPSMMATGVSHERFYRVEASVDGWFDKDISSAFLLLMKAAMDQVPRSATPH